MDYYKKYQKYKKKYLQTKLLQFGGKSIDDLIIYTKINKLFTDLGYNLEKDQMKRNELISGIGYKIKNILCKGTVETKSTYEELFNRPEDKADYFLFFLGKPTSIIDSIDKLVGYIGMKQGEPKTTAVTCSTGYAKIMVEWLRDHRNITKSHINAIPTSVTYWHDIMGFRFQNETLEQTELFTSLMKKYGKDAITNWLKIIANVKTDDVLGSMQDDFRQFFDTFYQYYDKDSSYFPMDWILKD